MKPHLAALTLLFAGLAFSASANAAVLLSTDFTGRTVAGKTASNVIWTEAGLSAPTSLLAVDEVPTSGAFSALFDTGNAQGHFAPDKNIGNEGPWSATTTLSVTGLPVSLESIDIDWQHFNNAGAFQGVNRHIRWTVTVTGSTSGLLTDGTAVETANATSGLNNLVFPSALTLSSSETYDVKFLVDNNGNTSGNNTGFDALIFNGTVVPEPSSTAVLLGLCTLGLLRRRRA